MGLDMAHDRSPARASRLPLPENLMLLVPGFLVSVVVAVAAQFLSDHYGAPAMLMALLLGIAFHFLAEEGRCAPGIAVSAKGSAFRRGAPRDPGQRRASGEPGIRCHLFGRRWGCPDHPVRNAWRTTVEARMALCAPDRRSRGDLRGVCGHGDRCCSAQERAFRTQSYLHRARRDGAEHG